MEWSDEAVETTCEAMHDAYEEAALRNGWATQERSRKPWADVPEANKATMRVSVRVVMTRTVELAAERGGTMTAERMIAAWEAIDVKHDSRSEQREIQDHIFTLGARNATLEGWLADLAEVLLGERPVGVMPSTTLDAARALKAERDTLSQRLAETNHKAQANWEKQEAEREQLEREVRAADLARATGQETSAWLRIELSMMRARAEHAEARVRELVIAGQELSAVVDKHVGESHEPVKVHAKGVLLLTGSGVIPMGHCPCSPTCTHDDAAIPGHPERVEELSEAFSAPAGIGMCCAIQAERDAEAMRAACMLAIHQRLAVNGFSSRDPLWNDLTTSIEGASP